MQFAVIIFALFVLMGCGEAPTQTTTETASTVNEAAAEQTLPPGFTDAPPPAPESNTLVLSGGSLRADIPTADSVVVIQDGRLIAWGKRGAVDIPNDSIGMDMRGKWIVPGTLADIKSGNLPNLDALRQGEMAALLVLNRDPVDTAVTMDDLHATIAQGSFNPQEETP